ncbi:MAG: hypothetical protein HY907_08640, partial [Deltaproteobacteria bacterium]|nr:hypothetical protein [Deltaproteobacteria bacterium]
MRFAHAVIVVVACTLVMATACGGGADPCDGVDCGEGGRCVSDGIAPRCACDPDFHPVMLSCVPDGADADGDGDGDADSDADDGADVETEGAGDDGEGGEADVAVCGNAVVESGEDCDEDPARACTTMCDSAGTEACASDCRWSDICDPPLESCSGVDDDCDTEVDEDHDCIRGSIVACTTSCASTGTGTCTDACAVPGSDACTPPPEACGNGADDDCDTATDEPTPEQCVPGTTVACTASCATTGSGICTAGCVPPLPADCVPPAETCNDADDDCDTLVDEDFACRIGGAVACATTCATAGYGTCTTSCEIPVGAACTPPSEVCNATDDDCDGTTDDGFTCALGASQACTVGTCGGTRTCVLGCTWDGCVLTTTETCDGTDDDCDGATDEGFACVGGTSRACTASGAGTTCPGTESCRADCAGYDACAATSTETCDGTDDDCDLVIDDGFACALGAARTCTVGTCAGTQSCTAACAWGACTVTATEVCNG